MPIRTDAVEVMKKGEFHQEIRNWLTFEQRSFLNDEKIHCDEITF
jgi:hypothetical protein